MKLLITGGKGMLGRTLQKVFKDDQLFIYDFPEYDILNGKTLQTVFAQFQPDVCIHCAAMTDVDRCEDDYWLAFDVNVIGTKTVALMCKKFNVRLIVISTDYVFSGNIPINESYYEEDFANGTSVYGKTKRDGEKQILEIYPENSVILRVAWLYGNTGPSFVHTIVNLGKQKEPAQLKVVNDQSGNPTSTLAVADIIKFIIGIPEIHGIVHGTCEGRVTRYEFATEIFKQLKIDKEIVPCLTKDFPRKAKRPFNSSLRKSVLYSYDYKVPNWKDALKESIENDLELN